MVYNILVFLKKIFGITSTTPAQETQPPASEPQFKIDHEWPFPSNKPNNTDYLIGELIRGVTVLEGHAFYVYKGDKKRHLRTTNGNETLQARHIVWWMEGRKVPATANGLVTNCGEPKCIKVSHLVLNNPQIPLGPRNRPFPEAVHTKHPLPPKIKEAKLGNPVKESNHDKGDRTKCMTRKVFFETDKLCKDKARILNSKEIRGRGRKVYSYDCPYCTGFHLTKISQSSWEKKNKSRKPKGSWS